MERRIGEVFIWNRSRYTVAEHDCCGGCCFYRAAIDKCLMVYDGEVSFFGDCWGVARTDKKNVIFVQLDNE